MVLFYQVGLEEKELLKVSTLKYVRHKLGLLCCITNPMASQAQVEAILSKLCLFMARDCLYSLYQELAPNTVQRCLNNLQRHYGVYIVPGPDFIWLIDGYLKLVLYRFKIYAAINAYSYYII
ncbi:hypothetical protein BDW60DRAFT_221005 [Aspergillus nidulans var. acristatus]